MSNFTKLISAKKQSLKKGVYAEINAELYERLQARRGLNKKRRLEADSNYKIIEASLTMLLDYLDELDLVKDKT